MLPYRRRNPRPNPDYSSRRSVKDVLREHSGKIERQVRTSNLKKIDYSKEYSTFKKELAPELSRYEKWCRSLGNVIKLKVSEKDEKKIQKNLDVAHLDLEPWQPLSLSVMAFLSLFFLGLIISIAISFLNGGIENFPILFFLLIMISSLFLFYYMNNYPKRMANQWRLKASSQMVPAILYVVVYMRHTSNLERAIAFASEHLEYPLALDLKKVFYDVSVGKFSTIKSSLDNYLETWEDYSVEFIEAFHLIEGSLFEPSNERRIKTLEKSLQVILDGVHDKMLKFTHEVRSPLTNVYMLGVVLPTLALALLPLASAMLGGILKTIHVFLLFNLIIPFLVFYLTDKVLMMRPGGYGETTLLERNPLYAKYKSKKPYAKALLISLPLIIIGLLPMIFMFLQIDFTFSQIGLGIFGEESFFGFEFSDTGKIVSGPLGTGALLLGMFFPVGIAMFFIISFKEKTKELIIQRNKTKQLENEFNNSLFQLGNRIGNGTPPELAFGKVAESSKGLITEDFFQRVNYNIRQLGMSVERAIFDPRRGALASYSSNLIGTSMRILVQSVKKGLNAAAKSLMSISEYIKNIKKITNRLKDMLAEVISDMKSNMTFLAPLLSGIVVGLASMITSILGKLKLAELAGEAESLGGMATIEEIFDLSQMIPPYLLQISIGIYLIQIIFILTGTLVMINSGQDKLQKTNLISKNLKKGMVLYFITAVVATLALFILTSVVLGDLIA